MQKGLLPSGNSPLRCGRRFRVQALYQVRSAGYDVVRRGGSGHGKVVAVRVDPGIVHGFPKRSRRLQFSFVQEAPAGVEAVQLVASQAQAWLPVRDNCFGKKLFKMGSRQVRS